jgi:hypothetical protein
MSEERNKESVPAPKAHRAAKSESISKDETKQLRPIIEDLLHDEAAAQNAMVSDIKRLAVESRQHKGHITFDATAFYIAHEKAIWGLLCDIASQDGVNVLRYLGRFKSGQNVTSLEDLQEMLAHWARSRVASKENDSSLT